MIGKQIDPGGDMTSENDDEKKDSADPNRQINEQIQHSPVSARIPPSVGRGVFSTGAIVFEGPSEFVIDFVLRLGQPHAITSRVVLSHNVFAQFLNALRDNLKMYEDRFGKPPALPQPKPSEVVQNTTTIADLYDQLKIPDEQMSGVYANAVMIGHTPSEFWFDFITNFFPKSAVSSRVILTSQQIPGLVETMTTSFQQFQRKMEGGGGLPPGSNPPGH
jgi:hypothetical protein